MTRIVRAVQRARTRPASEPMRVVVPRDVPPENLFVDAWNLGPSACPSSPAEAPDSPHTTAHPPTGAASPGTVPRHAPGGQSPPVAESAYLARQAHATAPHLPAAPAAVAPVVAPADPQADAVFVPGVTRWPMPASLPSAAVEPSVPVAFEPPTVILPDTADRTVADLPLADAPWPGAPAGPAATAVPSAATPAAPSPSPVAPVPESAATVSRPPAPSSRPVAPTVFYGRAFVDVPEEATRAMGRAAAPVAADVREKVVVGETCPPLMREQYRRLAATLHQTQLDRDVRSVLVVSPGSGEGRSLTAVNLAATLSSSYRRRVLLLDADLRHGTLHRVFGTAGEPGLLDAVRAGTAVPVTPLTDHLALAPAGSSGGDPIAVLSSGRMREILRAARLDYDWVVVDTPPLAQVPDAGLLMDEVDAAILVVDAGRTPCDLVQRCLRLIPGDRLLGVVLNRTHPRDMRGTGLPDDGNR